MSCTCVSDQPGPLCCSTGERRTRRDATGTAKFWWSICLAGLLFASALPVKADGVRFYTDLRYQRTAWNNAVAGYNITTITFDGLGPDKMYSSGLTVNGVTFTGTGGYLVVRGLPVYAASYLYGPPCCLPGSGWPVDDNITVTLPAGVIAVGWDFGNFYSPGVTVTLPDGSSYTDSADFYGFVGFTSTTPIQSFAISSPGFPFVQKFSFVIDPTKIDKTPPRISGMPAAGCTL